MQQFQRATVLGELVLDLVDGAHPAFTQAGYDAKLSRENSARSERAFGHQRCLKIGRDSNTVKIQEQTRAAANT